MKKFETGTTYLIKFMSFLCFRFKSNPTESASSWAGAEGARGGGAHNVLIKERLRKITNSSVINNNSQTKLLRFQRSGMEGRVRGKGGGNWNIKSGSICFWSCRIFFSSHLFRRVPASKIIIKIHRYFIVMRSTEHFFAERLYFVVRFLAVGTAIYIALSQRRRLFTIYAKQQSLAFLWSTPNRLSFKLILVKNMNSLLCQTVH